jgi:hypothetical protein
MIYRKMEKKGCKADVSYFLKNKKGQGHVEMILSFLIFIGALIFLFIFINPFAETKEVSVIEGLQGKITQEISLEIGKLGVILSCQNCCYDFDLADYVGNYQETQEDLTRKYNIYFGEIFNNITSKKSVSCNSGNYSLGAYSKEKMIVKDKIQELVTAYNNDYEALKSNLGITSEFAFSFKSLSGDEIVELTILKQPPVGVNVEAKEFPIRMINNSAGIRELILNLRAWR